MKYVDVQIEATFAPQQETKPKHLHIEALKELNLSRQMKKHRQDHIEEPEQKLAKRKERLLNAAQMLQSDTLAVHEAWRHRGTTRGSRQHHGPTIRFKVGKKQPLRQESQFGHAKNHSKKSAGPTRNHKNAFEAKHREHCARHIEDCVCTQRTRNDNVRVGEATRPGPPTKKRTRHQSFHQSHRTATRCAGARR